LPGKEWKQKYSVYSELLQRSQTGFIDADNVGFVCEPYVFTGPGYADIEAYKKKYVIMKL